MKQFDESVPRTLGEILIKHGRSPLTDPKLCENLLKDYCGVFKEEISLLVLAVKERVASDLLVSQNGLQRDLLHALLVKRLRKGHSLSAGDANWAVDSWRFAVRALSRAETRDAVEQVSPVEQSLPGPLNQQLKFGIIGKCEKPIRALAVSPLDESIVSGGDDGVIRVWNARSAATTVLEGYGGPISAVAFSPNGALIATASVGSRIQLTDLQSREVTLLGQGGKLSSSIAFSPGGKSVASASADSPCEIKLWNLQTGQMRVLKGVWSGSRSISFSPDGRQIAAADSDLTNPTIRLWDLETATMRIVGRSIRQITSIAFLAGGDLASGSWDETVRLWNVRTAEARLLGENCSCVCRIAISMQSDKLAAYSLDGRIRVWDIESGRSRTIGECHGINALSFLTDSVGLVTGSDDGTVRLWSTSSYIA